ncbi:MAG: CoA-acylating methylmalonate-semialdehyde dehydrogenase [Chloroflexi bacterium]|nr:CoA-acylating methylmalonate-semialdehyde dehydrogenase [Chloroflexota bacterium]
MTQVVDPSAARSGAADAAGPGAPGRDAAAAAAVDHWIAGRRVPGTSGRTGPVFDPATGRVAREVHFAAEADVDAAVAAAKAAFPGWRATSLSKRTEVMFRTRNLVEAHRHELAAHLTAEHGKVPSDALGEIARGLENLEFATGVAHLLKGGFSEQVSGGIDVYQIRQPLGVVAGITPFNFPAMVPMWMFATAIACGNAFVLKPSEKDPSASLYLAELLKEAGVPDGVFNVVQGDKVAVDRILEHPDIAAVSFVGSTPIARYIYETGTRHGKRVQALGGAKNHMLVLPDADVNMAADAAVSAGYGSSGERCMAIATIVAVGASADPLIAAIRERLPKIKVGPGTDPAAEMGPLVTKQHRDKVASYLDSAAAQGATVVADGREHPLYEGSDGFFLGVSLIDRVTPDMDCYRDEIFGPVLTVTRAETYADAVQLINDNPYGNGTAIFTRDGGAARQFQFDVNVGMVGINIPVPVPVAYYSFGGWKASLFGDLHMYGPEGIQFYTRAKVVTARWPDPGTSKVDLGFPRTR